MAFHPYLNFGGNCREAFTRYQEIFGGELVLLPMSDMPSEADVPPDQADLIMHAALTFEGHLLMASDDPQGASTAYEACTSTTRSATSPRPSGCSRPWPTAGR